MGMVRRKTVTMEGADFVIAPLNDYQVESFLSNPVPVDVIKSGVAAWRVGRAKLWDVIGWGLDNALPDDAAPETRFVDSNGAVIEARVRKLDLPLMDRLFDEILGFSGLKRMVDVQPGESPAASEPKTLPASGAASLQ